MHRRDYAERTKGGAAALHQVFAVLRFCGRDRGGLNELLQWSYWPCYLIALVLSVVWNFTLNRRYTFQSANNVPVAMCKVFAFYCVFTPLSTLLGSYLADTLLWNEYLVTALNMIANFVLEFLYDRFYVFRDSIDTNDRARRA